MVIQLNMENTTNVFIIVLTLSNNIIYVFMPLCGFRTICLKCEWHPGPKKE